MRTRLPIILVLGVPVLCAFTILAYNLPPIHDNLAWRVDDLRARIKYAINPPEEVVFVPQEKVEPNVQATLQARTSTPSPDPTSSPTVPGPTHTPLPSPTVTLSPTPIPPAVRLSGFAHVWQKFNNCGPATLAMELSYWEWPPDLANFLKNEESRSALQDAPAKYLKPIQDDKNVMPYEMETFIEEVTGLQAIVRVGGDLDMLKRLIAAGFPVMVERGFEPEARLGWMGHYGVFSGFDDAKSRFYTQDSYTGPGVDVVISYEVLTNYWRHFNHTYLVVYPPDRESEVLALLGPQADETYNFRYAAQKASDEIYALTGRDQFFAWYNRGTNLVKLQDYSGAALAYDEAFAIYPSIPEKQRPWRMLWYQTGPYFAYYYTGRYYDVISLSTKTIQAVDKPAIEESFYWRGLAKAALGDTTGAIEDFRASLEWHPDFEPSLYQLNAMVVEP